MQGIKGRGFTCFAISLTCFATSKGEKNLTIKCHKDLYHVTVLTYIIKTCLTIPGKIKQEKEMLTKR